MLHREQTRNPYFLSFNKGSWLFLSLLLKVLPMSGTCSDSVAVPLKSVEGDIQIKKRALQKQLRPSLNWPMGCAFVEKVSNPKTVVYMSYGTAFHFGGYTDSSTLQIFAAFYTSFDMSYPTNISAVDADL